MSNKEKIIKHITTLSPLITIILLGLVFTTHYWVLNIGGVTPKYISEVVNAKEYFWRITWGLSSIFLIIVCTFSLGISAYIINKNIKCLDSETKVLIVTFIIGLCIPITTFFFKKGLSGSIGELMFESISYLTALDDFKVFVNSTMSYGAIAVFLIAVSSSSIIAKPKYLNVGSLADSYKDYRRSFYLTSLLLCATLIQISCLFFWSANVNTCPDNSEKKEPPVKIESPAKEKSPVIKKQSKDIIAKAFTMGSAVIYTMVFIILFIFVANILNHRLQYIIDTKGKKDPEELKKWLELHGLMRTPLRLTTDFLLLISPLLLGIAAILYK